MPISLIRDVGRIARQSGYCISDRCCGRDACVAVLQQALDERSRVGFVVDHQDIRSRSRSICRQVPESAASTERVGCWREMGAHWIIGGGHQRQHDPKCRALSCPALFALIEPPCSSTSCLTIDSPSPRPPCARGTGGVGLAKPIEYVRQESGIDASPAVGHLDFQVGVDLRKA